MKALFRIAKIAFGLHNFHQGLCDLREAARNEPINLDITNERAKIESQNCQVGTNNTDLKESKLDGSCLAREDLDTPQGRPWTLLIQEKF